MESFPVMRNQNVRLHVCIHPPSIHQSSILCHTSIETSFVRSPALRRLVEQVAVHRNFFQSLDFPVFRCHHGHARSRDFVVIQHELFEGRVPTKGSNDLNQVFVVQGIVRQVQHPEGFVAPEGLPKGFQVELLVGSNVLETNVQYLQGGLAIPENVGEGFQSPGAALVPKDAQLFESQGQVSQQGLQVGVVESAPARDEAGQALVSRQTRQ
mmetsp:Transcript_24439/g.57751  ORF Transcript_24439/g.57751 Transcript_24439/m.57751 type:complete len:211 (+) Transcript_24439:188-820(+)